MTNYVERRAVGGKVFIDGCCLDFLRDCDHTLCEDRVQKKPVFLRLICIYISLQISRNSDCCETPLFVYSSIIFLLLSWYVVWTWILSPNGVSGYEEDGSSKYQTLSHYRKITLLFLVFVKTNVWLILYVLGTWHKHTHTYKHINTHKFRSNSYWLRMVVVLVEIYRKYIGPLSQLRSPYL